MVKSLFWFHGFVFAFFFVFFFVAHEQIRDPASASFHVEHSDTYFKF